MEFNEYRTLEETYPEFALLNLNLCCKCIKPIIRRLSFDKFVCDIIPQTYHNEVGIFRILGTVNQSNNCILWKKDDSFTLDVPPVTSNIYVDTELQVRSVCKRTEENGRIEALSIESEDRQCAVDMLNTNIDWTCHEIAFFAMTGWCLTRRKENDGKSFLRLYRCQHSLDTASIRFSQLDYSIVDANFPSIESVPVFVNWRGVDEDYISKRSITLYISLMKTTVIPSYIYFQLADGSTVTIPLEVLSLSQLAYIALSRIPQPSQQEQQRQLRIVKISLMYYFFQRIRNLFRQRKENVPRKGFFRKKVNANVVWMSQEFIKKQIGWPKILPLIKAPVLPMKSE